VLMNAESISKWVEYIRAEVEAGDDLCASGLEQHLFLEFILHVSRSGTKRLRDLANEILKSRDVCFLRLHVKDED